MTGRNSLEPTILGASAIIFPLTVERPSNQDHALLPAPIMYHPTLQIPFSLSSN
jgi:hypothetical protein